MPEGDVVWRTASQLHDALAGRVLVRSDFRVPRFATTDLTGRTVIEALSRGKHLLIRVDGDISSAYPPADGWILADRPGIRLSAARPSDQAGACQCGI